MAQHPGTRVHLQVANTAEIVREVKHFEMDMGLIEGEINDPELEVIPWRDDELVVFCAPGHPLADKKTLTDEDLLTATWILREPGSGTRQTFDRALHGLLPDLNVLLELQHTEAIKRATEAGLGIACLSRITLLDAFRRGSLVPLEVPHRHVGRHVFFILHRHEHRSAGLERWLELCRTHLYPCCTARLTMSDKTTELAAAACRRLVAHLRERSDAQNIDLMNLAGFCRN